MRQTPVITNKGRVIAFVPNSSFLPRQPRSWVRPARTRANQSCDARQGVLGNVVHTNRDIYTATPVFTLQMHIIAKNVYKVFPSCIWGRVTSLVVCKCDLLLALPLTYYTIPHYTIHPKKQFWDFPQLATWPWAAESPLSWWLHLQQGQVASHHFCLSWTPWRHLEMKWVQKCSAMIWLCFHL